MLINRQKNNPLKIERRDFPLDFSHFIDHASVTTFNLPEGYVVADTLRNRSLTASGEDMNFKRLFRVEGNCVQASSQFEIRKSQFQPNRYKEIRDFYGQVANIHAEQFTIIPAPPQVVAAPPAKPAPSSKQKGKGTTR
jgi:hypothetical protein